MSGLAGFAAPLADTALARWLHSGWVFPLVESTHIVSFALLVGAIAVVDVRLLGGLRHQAVAPLLRSALPVAIAGFAGAVTSGALLFVANADELVANRAFVAKLALLALAGLNAAAFHASVGREALTAAVPTAAMRLAGAVSLLLWVAVIVAGRLIAYV